MLNPTRFGVSDAQSHCNSNIYGFDTASGSFQSHKLTVLIPLAGEQAYILILMAKRHSIVERRLSMVKNKLFYTQNALKQNIHQTFM